MQKIIFGLLISLIVCTQPCISAPELYLPPDDTRFGKDDSIVVFEWEDIQCSEYEMELAIDSSFEIGTGPLNTGIEPFFSLSDLIPDDIWFPLTITLFWRVRGVSEDNGPGEWSETFQFHKTTLSVPGIISGRDDRFNQDTDMPVLTWENPDNATRFRVEFAMDDAFLQSFGQVPVNEPELDLTIPDRTVWDTLQDVFYWRVSAMTDCHTPGPWSGACRLSKTTHPPPLPVSPDDGAVYAPDSAPPILEWDSGNVSDPYHLRLFFDKDGKYEMITLDAGNVLQFDFARDLGITDDVWRYVPLTFFWGVAGFDDAGRPGVFSTPRELVKPGYHRVSAFGDSITEGKCFDNGYLGILHDKLVTVWGNKTTSVNIAVPGMKSRWGAENINARLQMSNPQFTLIMFGTNDSVDPGNCDPPYDCDVAGHLAEMIEITRNRGSIPVISTIIPVNPEGRHAQAQSTIDYNNQLIIGMALQMQVELVDLDAKFRDYGNLPALFCDWGHPNETGYHIMADAFFDGIMNTAPAMFGTGMR